jgi:hypothetical protein
MGKNNFDYLILNEEDRQESLFKQAKIKVKGLQSIIGC